MLNQLDNIAKIVNESALNQVRRISIKSLLDTKADLNKKNYTT